MQDKQVSSACIRRTFHRNRRGKYNGAFPVYQLVLLVAGKYIGEDYQYQEYQSQLTADLFQMHPFGEEEQDQESDKQDKTNDADLRP